jgi:phosphoserine aminotransferase
VQISAVFINIPTLKISNISILIIRTIIVREDLIGNVVQNQPILFDYATQANNDSMYNTPFIPRLT